MVPHFFVRIVKVNVIQNFQALKRIKEKNPYGLTVSNAGTFMYNCCISPPISSRTEVLNLS